MTRRMRVGVIFGGANSEHDVSCASASGVLGSLDPVRFEPVPIGIDRGGRWHRFALPSASVRGNSGIEWMRELERAAGSGTAWPDFDGVDVAFPALHGRFGEDGSVQGLLELAGVPYVGCGILASATAMDKAATGRLLAAVGLAVPRTVVVALGDRIVDPPEFPVFAKPNRAGSSVGVTRVEALSGLSDAVARALAEDATALVQEAVRGEEVDVGVLQHSDGSLSIGPPLRVRSNHDFFDTAAKYTPGGVIFDVPAAMDESVRHALELAAGTAFRALGCDGLARVDFFVDGETIVVNEVNTMPGMTVLSQFPRIWQASGVSYSDILSTLIDRAMVVVR